MRIWHKDLLSILPEKQFKGQNRELVAILHDWRDKCKTNHILINKVMDYDKSHLGYYAELYYNEYLKRYGKVNKDIIKEFEDFCFPEKKPTYEDLFKNWHNKDYLKQCYYNLEEKFMCGGINVKEWLNFINNYCKI